MWNESGRAHFTEYSTRLAAFYGGDSDVDLDLKDPRTAADGDRVVKTIIDLNELGDWQRARELFDPAYAPVFRWIEPNNKELGFVTILGPDELLVRHGSAWHADGQTYHLHGGTATPLPDITGMARSRNRDHLVLARAAGLVILDARAGLNSTPRATIPWPNMSILMPRGLSAEEQAAWSTTETALEIEELSVSDDGMRIVVSCYRQGILLASRHPGEPVWQLLLPDARSPYHDDDGDAPTAGDMTHVAISRDGTRLAWGEQSSSHHLARIGAGGDAEWYASVGPASEYPHRACFSDDGRHVALNSCHFYNGVTVAFDWEGNGGKSLASYEAHPEAPVIDGSLRVYSACWLPNDVLAATMGRPVESAGAFVLAGSGIMRCVNVKGQLAFVQGFGSSAGSIDFCPESRRLAIGAYSGFLHVYDPYEEELPGRIDGVRARREVARWIFWSQLPNGPIRW